MLLTLYKICCIYWHDSTFPYICVVIGPLFWILPSKCSSSSPLTSCHRSLSGSPAEETGRWFSPERQNRRPLHKSRQSLRHGRRDLPQSARPAPAAGGSHQVGFPPFTSLRSISYSHPKRGPRDRVLPRCLKRHFRLCFSDQLIIFWCEHSQKGPYVTTQSEFNLCKWTESAILIRKRRDSLLCYSPLCGRR